MDRAAALRAEIRGHKAAIRRHREDLRRKAAALAQLELVGRGVSFVSKAKGETNPWPSRYSHSTP